MIGSWCLLELRFIISTVAMAPKQPEPLQSRSLQPLDCECRKNDLYLIDQHTLCTQNELPIVICLGLEDWMKTVC